MEFAKGLENCVHLKICIWTRDGSLTSEILSSLGKCSELTDVTFNGGYYKPMDFVQLLRLRKISLIMPSASALSILPRWLWAIGRSLTSLSLVCKASLCPPNAAVLFIYGIGRPIHYGQLPGESLTISFTDRTSQIGWVSKRDERGCLVNCKT
jgi:hypothetical protein